MMFFYFLVVVIGALILWKALGLVKQGSATAATEMPKPAGTRVGSNVPKKLNVPRLSRDHDRQIEVNHNRSKERVNTYKMTCSCEDFNNKHSLYAVDDIRRFCKHLIQTYSKLVNINCLEKFQKAILSAGYGVKSNLLYLTDKEGKQGDESVLVLYDKDNPWWEIYAENDQKILQCYGFNILEERWASNQSPSKIKNDLERFFSNHLSSTQVDIDDDLLQIREIVSKINTKEQLRDLERRLDRAEKRYSSPESNERDDKKYDILCRSWDIARDKIYR